MPALDVGENRLWSLGYLVWWRGICNSDIDTDPDVLCNVTTVTDLVSVFVFDFPDVLLGNGELCSDAIVIVADSVKGPPAVNSSSSFDFDLGVLDGLDVRPKRVDDCGSLTRSDAVVDVRCDLRSALENEQERDSRSCVVLP